MNLHVWIANTVLMFLRRSRRKTALPALNAEAEDFEKRLVFFLSVEMCPIRGQDQDPVVAEAAPRVEVRVSISSFQLYSDVRVEL